MKQGGPCSTELPKPVDGGPVGAVQHPLQDGYKRVALEPGGLECTSPSLGTASQSALKPNQRGWDMCFAEKQQGMSVDMRDLQETPVTSAKGLSQHRFCRSLAVSGVP